MEHYEEQSDEDSEYYDEESEGGSKKSKENKSNVKAGKWTEAEDELLRRTIQEHGAKNWKQI